MLTRYWDRRRYIRVPASGPTRWQSGPRHGHAELRDISPGGAGLRMSARQATRLDAFITLAVELSPGEKWYLAKNARVARRTPDEDGMCLVGVEFSPQPPQVARPANGRPVRTDSRPKHNST